MNNEIRDEVHVRLHNLVPDIPVGIYPEGSGINPDVLVLEAGSFSDPEGDDHVAAYYRVYENCEMTSNPVVNEFINHENWYYGENTQESVELTNLPIAPLSGNTNYCWQVKYRDGSLGWSSWSLPIVFQTSESQFSNNLLILRNFMLR